MIGWRLRKLQESRPGEYYSFVKWIDKKRNKKKEQENFITILILIRDRIQQLNFILCIYNAQIDICVKLYARARVCIILETYYLKLSIILIRIDQG